MCYYLADIKASVTGVGLKPTFFVSGAIDKTVNEKKRIAIIEELITSLFKDESLELVLIRVIRKKKEILIKVMIDSETGISIDDCNRAGRLIRKALDGSEGIGAYSLEVSSPGVERPLVKKQDFERFRNRKVFIKVEKPIEDRKQFSGVLGSLIGNKVVVLAEGKRIEIPLELITKVHLIVSDEELFKR